MTERIYFPNTILWIEDQAIFVRSIMNRFSRYKPLIEALGSNPKLVSPIIINGCSQENAQSEIERMIQEAGESAAVVNMATAQTARTYLEQYIPGGIICDSVFPLNGSVTIKWLQEHGLKDYPLIGFSCTSFEKLPTDTKQFFISTPARYFNKFDLEDLPEGFNLILDSLIFSREWVLIRQKRDAEGKRS
jgi:hypothetical protein